MQNQVTEHQDKPWPLEGIKVVEYGVFHAGPGCGAILGDLGADVIKIESGIGDPERYWTNVAGMDLTFDNGACAIFEATNRNKKGIYLDIENPKGRDIFNRLVKDADVFHCFSTNRDSIENVTVGGMLLNIPYLSSILTRARARKEAQSPTHARHRDHVTGPRPRSQSRGT